MQQKSAMNKALEQKLIGPMEESHTKEQSPPNSFVRGALSKEIENGSKMSLDSGLSWLLVFGGGRWSVWVQE